MKKGHHYEDLKDKFNYPIIKDKRYTKDAFKFHLSIVCNYTMVSKPDYNKFNTSVLKFVKNNGAINIIGIDRGERNLISVTVISGLDGSIIESRHLNVANDIDFLSLLKNVENIRQQERETWSDSTKIKDLKENYVGAAVYELYNMILKYNALVFMEDLSRGFKDSRKSVERSVYNNFEQALIKKLNFLTLKDKLKTPNEKGGLLNSYQLTNKFESMEKIGIQSGIVFFIPAAYTSKICPATSFVNLFGKFLHYKNMDLSKEFFSKLKSVNFNKQEGFFEFDVDYVDFMDNVSVKQTKWTICTHGDTRYQYNKQTKTSEPINVTEELKKLFNQYRIKFDENIDIRKQILQISEKDFFVSIFKFISLTLQLRYNKTGTNIDYILSPVKDKNGNFFDSRISGDDMPKDSDLNGSYFIALKGLLILRRINNTDENELCNMDPTISRKQWFEFAYDFINNRKLYPVKQKNIAVEKEHAYNV